MTGKNKFLFALSIVSIILAVFALVGATVIGLPVSVTDPIMIVAGLLFIVMMFAIMGVKRILKWCYFAIVADVVYMAVVNAITGGILTAVIWIVIAVLMILSLIPLVFKNLN